MEPTFEVKNESTQDNYGQFVLSPLPAGYGLTLGVALRRVLLNSLTGGAITSVQIEGVKHQFSTLKGMKEDVLDFLLNLKLVRVKITGSDPVKLKLSINRTGEVKAGDIEVPAGVEIANPELVLATLSKSAKLNAEMTAQNGVGYLLADERPQERIGEIHLDASFSPVSRVNYKVEETRVGRVTNYDKLTLEIWTDGIVSPNDALISASGILVSYFQQIVAPKKQVESLVAEVSLASDSLGSVGKLSVEEIGLPTRVANALVKAGFETVEKLVVADKNELIKVRNLGEKSLKIVSAALSEKGVSF